MPCMSPTSPSRPPGLATDRQLTLRLQPRLHPSSHPCSDRSLAEHPAVSERLQNGAALDPACLVGFCHASPHGILLRLLHKILPNPVSVLRLDVCGFGCKVEGLGLTSRSCPPVVLSSCQPLPISAPTASSSQVSTSSSMGTLRAFAKTWRRAARDRPEQSRPTPHPHMQLAIGV